MTNREWINNLSDKEFAKLIYNYSACDCCILHGMDNINCKQDCFENMEKWFAQEHIIPLKKCPFCGGDVTINIKGGVWFIACAECKIVVNTHHTFKNDAIHAWNTRVGDENDKL